MKGFFQLLVFILFLTVFTDGKAQKNSSTKSKNQYSCTPCGYDCDKAAYDVAGNCSACNMPLVKLSGFSFRNISTAEICHYIKKHPETVLLDVRTKAEFEGTANPDFGSLQNAINIPVQELANRMSSISYLKNKEILVYCSHSHRSPQASYLLRKNGFKKVINLSGGMSVMTDNTCKIKRKAI